MFVAAMYSLFWTRRGDAFMEFFMYIFFLHLSFYYGAKCSVMYVIRLSLT